MVVFRSLYRSICRRSIGFSSSSAAVNHPLIRHIHTISPPPFLTSCKRIPSDYKPEFATSIISKRLFSVDAAHLPEIKDPEIERVLKNIIAVNWDELPSSVIHDTKKVLSKNSDDKSGHEALANTFRAAEAVEEFTGILISLKMEIDDSIGMSGEDVKILPEKYVKAMEVIFQRYNAYLDSFGPNEVYLKKKVENELGTRMIYLKMRCSGLNSGWGKVSVLGTSGLAGSYVEKRY